MTQLASDKTILGFNQTVIYAVLKSIHFDIVIAKKFYRKIAIANRRDFDAFQTSIGILENQIYNFWSCPIML